MRRKRICIIAFKPVAHTIHVLRQIDYLAPHYDLTVIGHGASDPRWPPLAWYTVPEQTRAEKVTKLFWYLAARALPCLYHAWFWHVRRHRLALQHTLSSTPDAIHANDWEALPIAVEAARRTGARVVFHMHEYAEEERTEGIWRLLVSPAIRYLNRRYTSGAPAPVDLAITVCRPIAERYREELGLQPIVVFNAPKPVHLRAEAAGTGDAGRIRMIHHGFAKRGRGLHKLIEALARADKRFTLDFMLMEDDGGYIDELRALAERLAPGRVHFLPPVAPGSIVRRIAEYDLGLCVIEPNPYNNLMMLPNKFFEYIQAGLAVCTGPSPAMADLVHEYGFGITAPGFDPSAVAATLNRLTERHLLDMKEAARQAALTLNADVEMGKIVKAYQRLFESTPGRVEQHAVQHWEVAAHGL